MHPYLVAAAPLSQRRLFLWSVGYLLLAFPLVFIAYRPIPLGPLPMGGNTVLVALALLFLTRTLLRRQGRSLAELGLSFSARAAKHLVFGLGAGVLLHTTAALLLRLALPFEWERNPTFLPQAITGALLFHLLTNTCEELAWRGYAFWGLMRTLGHWPAQVIVALVAACFHVLSGWSWQVALISTTAGSLLFALVFLRWQSIPAAIGVHAAWNWTRDLILTPAAPTALWYPKGTDQWTISGT